jgi:hypothetical protein
VNPAPNPQPGGLGLYVGVYSAVEVGTRLKTPTAPGFCRGSRFVCHSAETCPAWMALLVGTSPQANSG